MRFSLKNKGKSVKGNVEDVSIPFYKKSWHFLSIKTRQNGPFYLMIMYIKYIILSRKESSSELSNRLGRGRKDEIMNPVSLIGRLTKDPEVRYGAASQMAVARFSIAIDRGKDKDGNDRGADFPSIVCFGKVAENVEKYLSKGKLVGISGRLQTGSYEKDGRKFYTTEVLADRVEFLERIGSGSTEQTAQAPSAPPEGFTQIMDDDIPF